MTPTRISKRASLGALELGVLGLFFFSGASALVYEVVWSRRMTYVFGGSAYAIATVLAAYMAGLALGSAWFGRRIDRRGHPLVVYGILEAAIGVWALLLPFFLDWLDPVYRTLFKAVDGGGGALAAFRFVFCFFLLLVPTTMMGGTLPVLGKLLISDWKGLGTRAGILYGVNTLGAVVGVAAGGFLLIPILGLNGSTWVAVLVNLLVAAAAVAMARRYAWSDLTASQAGDTEEAAQAIPPGEARLRRSVLIVYAASGFAALSYEVVWTKVLALILGTTTYAFTSMLTTFLLGLALGALIFGWIADRTGRPASLLVVVQTAIPVIGLSTVPLLERLPQLWVDGFTTFNVSWASLELYRFLLSASVMFLPALLMGGTFPLVTRMFARRGEVGRSLGVLYASNTIGAIAGSVATGFILVPLLGRQNSILVAAFVNLAAAAVLLSAIRWRDIPTFARVATALLLVALVPASLMALRPWNPRLMGSGAYYYAQHMSDKDSILEYMREAALLYYHESTEASVAVWQIQHVTSLRMNGKIDASTHIDMVTQKLVAHLPMLYHGKGNESVLMVGLASGISTGALLRYPVASVETVELVSGVDEAARFFSHHNYNCLDDPRHTLIINDGRNQLSLADKSYDVIVSQPTNPMIAGVGSLFTREFYELVRSRLNPGGVASVWMQIYHMRAEDLKAALATMSDVFPYTHLWMGLSGDLIVLGSDEPLVLDLDRVAPYFAGKPGDDLRRLEILPQETLLGYFVTDTEGLDQFTSGVTQRVTDDNLYLEYAIPRNVFRPETQMSPSVVDEVRRMPSTIISGPRDDPGLGERADRAARARVLTLRAHLIREYPPGLDRKGTFRRTLAESPNDLLAREQLGHDLNEEGIAAIQRGDTETASRLFREVTGFASRSERALAWNNLGYVQYQAGQIDSARVSWNESAQLEPTHPLVNYNLGLLAGRSGDHQRATEFYELVAKYDPSNAGAMNNLAFHLMELGRSPEAESWARAAVDLEPIAIYLDTYGSTLLANGRYGKAASTLEQAVKADPDLAEAWLHLGEARSQQGRTEDARVALQRAADQSHDPDTATRARTLLDSL